MVLGVNGLSVALAMAYRLVLMLRDPAGPPTLGHQLGWHSFVIRMLVVYKHSVVFVSQLLLS